MLPSHPAVDLGQRTHTAHEAQQCECQSDPQAALQTHRALASRYLDAWLQPDETITDQDIRNLPTLIATENARMPGLNLDHHDSPADFMDHLYRIASDNDAGRIYRGRSILRVEENALHHAVADIYHRAGQPLSIIMPDSFMVSAAFAPGIEDAMQKRGVPCRFGADGTTVQKSPNDCVIFSLSFALKLHHHEALFDRIHLRQIADPDYRWSIRHDGVPAAFYKHSHSRMTLQMATQNHPELAEECVNKKGETLLTRQARFIGEFFSARRDSTRTYSNSIDHKRLSFIDRSRSHLAEQLVQKIRSSQQMTP